MWFWDIFLVQKDSSLANTGQQSEGFLEESTEKVSEIQLINFSDTAIWSSQERKRLPEQFVRGYIIDISRVKVSDFPPQGY